MWHSPIPDPLNGEAPRVTDIDLINLSEGDASLNQGDVVDINIQRSFRSIRDNSYEGDVMRSSERAGT